MLDRSRYLPGIFAGLLLMGVVPAFSQAVQFEDGLGTAKFHKPLAMGPPQTLVPGIGGTSLPYVSKPFLSLGSKNLPMQLVGTDPGAGAGSTTIPTVLVPLKFVFFNAPALPLDGTNIVPATANSPLFQDADYTTGGTDVGTTQYGDAIMRAEFWNYPGFSQAGYHVLLGTPTIASTVTITVPSTGCGSSGTSFCGVLERTSKGTLVGLVDINFFQGIIGVLHASYSASQMPMFLTDNVFLYQGTLSSCCVLGYHDSDSGAPATARTWIYSAYTEAGTFTGDAILDVQALSHEVSEWLNDPFVGNFSFGALNIVAPYVLPGTGGACQVNFETGDVLESPPIVFTKTIGGTTYHLQDEAFLPYFLHGLSFSVNGWYTYLNTFPAATKLCGAG